MPRELQRAQAQRQPTGQGAWAGLRESEMGEGAAEAAEAAAAEEAAPEAEGAEGEEGKESLVLHGAPAAVEVASDSREPSLLFVIIEHYEGEEKKGVPHGTGTAQFAGQNSYAGHFSHGKMSGEGVYTWASGIVYAGAFSHNEVTGVGKYTWPDGSSYEGAVLAGKRHGHGVFTCAGGGPVYTGGWQAGKRSGEGELKYNPDSYYKGACARAAVALAVRSYHHQQPSAFSISRRRAFQSLTMINKNGMDRDRAAGRVTSALADRSGAWLEDVKTGKGAQVYASGNKYDGEWKDNQKNGRGCMVWQKEKQRCGAPARLQQLQHASFISPSYTCGPVNGCGGVFICHCRPP